MRAFVLDARRYHSTCPRRSRAARREFEAEKATLRKRHETLAASARKDHESAITALRAETTEKIVAAERAAREEMAAAKRANDDALRDAARRREPVGGKVGACATGAEHRLNPRSGTTAIAAGASRGPRKALVR